LRPKRRRKHIEEPVGRACLRKFFGGDTHKRKTLAAEKVTGWLVRKKGKAKDG